ncbi:MAG: hypothetical protein KAQ93_07720 [Spirochaetales bacterium]|nr:hypothetical protein [Spirochaetales bacterium]
MLVFNYRSLSIKLLIIILLMLTTVTLPVFGDETTEKDSWAKFSIGLELLINEKTEEAMIVMEAIISEYPNTDAAIKAEEYIKIYTGRLDRSGIISFYLGNMITATWAAYSIPMILDIEDGIILGTTGIIGVGTGIYTSWLMSRNIDMSLGRDLWIEFIESVAVTNFQYAYSIFGDNITDSNVREKINIGSQAVTSLASRGLAYNYVIDKDPSAGRAFTVINAYAWSQYYLWVSLSEIFDSRNDNFNYSLGILVPDLAALGTFYLWDKAGWSVQRTGIISVSGIGGLLTGIFANMIIAEAGNFSPPSAMTSSIILGSSLAGKVIGSYATSKMEPDSKADKSLFTNINFFPWVSQYGTGFMINLSL